MRFLIYIGAFFLLTSLSQAQRKSKRKSKDAAEQQAQKPISGESKVKFEATLVEAEKQLVLDNSEKAIEMLEIALKLDPSSGAANFKLAEILSKEGNTAKALPYAEAALQADETNKYYYLLLAEIHKTRGAFQKAAESYDQMIRKVPGTESYLYDLAIIYQVMGELDLALEKYNEADEVFGSNEMALREKQKIYLQKKDYDAYIRDWDKLIAEYPDESRYTIELVQFLIKQDRTDEARQRLEKIEKKDLQVLLMMSQLEHAAGNTDKAMEISLDAFEAPGADLRTKMQLINGHLDLAITPEQFDIVISMANSLAEEYPEEFEAQAYAGDVLFRMESRAAALKAYLKAVRLNPGNYTVWQNILNIEAGMNNYDSVIVHAEEAMEYFPNQAILYYFSGTGHLINKDYRKSVTMLNMGKKFAADPSLLTIFYGQLGDAYNALKDSQKSFEAYDQALLNNPSNDHVLNNYSYFLSLDKKNMDKALEMSTKLVELHPDNPTYLDTHGWVLYGLEKYKEAKEFLHKAARLSDDGTILEHYGDVLFKLGETEEAVKQWKKASEHSDTSENILKKIADKTLYE